MKRIAFSERLETIGAMVRSNRGSLFRKCRIDIRIV